MYEMKSCLENAGKIYRGEKAMRRREEMVVTYCRNSAWSSKRHFKELTQGEVHLYTFFFALHFSQERAFPCCSSEVLAGLAECFRIIYAYNVCTCE